ncbi:hypothetical protein GCM10028819_33160 [Spirosoma humi]
MTAFEKDKTVEFLLTQLTFMLMAQSPIKDGIRMAAKKHEAQLKKLLKPEEYEPIITMRNTVAQLVRFLAECKTPEALEQAHDYIKDLNEGKVLIAVTDGSSPGAGYSEVGKSYLANES